MPRIERADDATTLVQGDTAGYGAGVALETQQLMVQVDAPFMKSIPPPVFRDSLVILVTHNPLRRDRHQAPCIHQRLWHGIPAGINAEGTVVVHAAFPKCAAFDHGRKCRKRGPLT